MTWREKQGPASFRGVRFNVETAEQSGGRQTAVHSFPFSERAPYSEDLGLRGREFTIEGYVVGADYETRRDALIRALEQPGPGELVHPYLGTRTVAVAGSYRVRQTRDAGGMATFSIPFVETTAKPIAPTSTVDASAVLTSKVSAAKASAAAAFTAARQAQTVIGGDLDLPGTLSASELGAFKALNLTMRSILASLPVLPDARAAFNLISETIAQNGEAYVYDTYSAAILGYTVRLFDAVAAAVSTLAPKARIGAFLRASEFDPGTRPSELIPARAQELANFDATVELARRLAVIYAAEATGGAVFVSYDDAIAAREPVADALDTLAAGVADSVFASLQDLRVALVAAVPGPDSDLPRLATYTPPAVVPSLVIAHRLYGNVDREQDLIDRNRIRHPGFVPALALEILSDG